MRIYIISQCRVVCNLYCVTFYIECGMDCIFSGSPSRISKVLQAGFAIDPYFIDNPTPAVLYFTRNWQMDCL